jgi:hypothetical protein
MPLVGIPDRVPQAAQPENKIVTIGWFSDRSKGGADRAIGGSADRR